MGKIIGFIGGGNMGGAIVGGIVGAGLATPEAIIVSDKNQEGLARLKETYGVRTTTDNRTAAAAADLLFLAVKPGIYPAVIPEIRDLIRPDTVIVSIAAGQTIAKVEALFEHPIRLMRVMPNTPALVGEAMSALSPNGNMEPEDIRQVENIFNSLGRAELVPESLMDAVVGVSGSSPAYVYMFIEAMADAAVADGMPRAQAYKFAAQAVLGSARMVLETGLHPGALKDMVCSPGGTTIEAVAVLEQEGLRSAVIKAQRACTEKSREMGKE